eukprot:227402_1
MGNQLKKEYNVNLDSQCGSGGLGLRWKLYKATDLKTKQEVTIFTFSKKELPKSMRKDGDRFINLLKKEVERGNKFKHPNCLRVIKPIKEFRGELAFVTERVMCSLSNILGDTVYPIMSQDNTTMPSFTLPPNLANFKFGALQIRSGLAQLCDATLFMHNDAHMAHAFIDPCNVYITEAGDWKLFGFEFAEHLATEHDEAHLDWDYTNTKEVAYYPSFSCLAPEIIISNIVTVKSDVFSIARLSYILHRQQAGIRRENIMKSADEYRRFINDLNIALSPHVMHGKGGHIPFEGIPPTLVDALKNALKSDEKVRCAVSDIVNCAYLNDMIVRVIRYLEKILEKEEDGKIKFLKKLPEVISMFDKQTLIHKVIPPLIIQIADERMVNYVVPSLLAITRVLSASEYSSLIEPTLCRFFVSKDLPQVFYSLCDNILLLCSKSSVESRRDKLIPMVLLAVGVRNVAIQTNVLKSIPSLVDKSYIEWRDLKNKLLPKLKQICNLSVGENSKITPLRVNVLMCLAAIFSKFDTDTITQVILGECVWRILHKTKESAVLMSVLGVADAIAKHVSPHIVAHHILPHIIPLLMEENLNEKQYVTFIKCVRYMIDKCDRYRINQYHKTDACGDQTTNKTLTQTTVKDTMSDILEKEFDPKQKGQIHKTIDDPFATTNKQETKQNDIDCTANNGGDMFMSLGNNNAMNNGGIIGDNNATFGGFDNDNNVQPKASNDETEVFGWNTANNNTNEMDNALPFTAQTTTTQPKRRVRSKGSVKASSKSKGKAKVDSYAGFGANTSVTSSSATALSAFGFINDENQKQKQNEAPKMMFSGNVDDNDMFSGMGIKSGDVFAGLGHNSDKVATAMDEQTTASHTQSMFDSLNSGNNANNKANTDDIFAGLF